MDDAKALLDSLMGTMRNTDRKEALKTKGNNFKESNICKHYLIGFCPQFEDLFHSTKRDIGSCKQVHSDAMKEEFEAHADKDKYQADYERKLKQYLEDLVRGADEWVARERRNIQDSNRLLEESGPNEVARGEIKKMNDQAASLLAEAEECAEAGHIQDSKVKADMAAELKKRAGDWEEKAKAAGVRGSEDVCLCCGSRMESGDLLRARFMHSEGKIHLGYVKIREWLADMRQRVRVQEEKDEARRAEKGSRRRERSRSRDGGRERGDRGDRDRDRRRDREEPQKALGGGDRGDRDAPPGDKEPQRDEREPAPGGDRRGDRDAPRGEEPPADRNRDDRDRQRGADDRDNDREPRRRRDRSRSCNGQRDQRDQYSDRDRDRGRERDSRTSQRSRYGGSRDERDGGRW